MATLSSPSPSLSPKAPLDSANSGGDYFTMAASSSELAADSVLSMPFEETSSIKRSLSKKLKIQELPRKLITISHSLKSSDSSSEKSEKSGKSSDSVRTLESNNNTNISNSSSNSNSNNSNCTVTSPSLAIRDSISPTLFSRASRVPAYVAASNLKNTDSTPAGGAAAQRRRTGHYSHHKQALSDAASLKRSSILTLNDSSLQQARSKDKSTASSLYRTTTNMSISSLPIMNSAYYQKKKDVKSSLNYDLPVGSLPLSCADLNKFFEEHSPRNFAVSNDLGSNTGPNHFIVIDIRPFEQYAKSRISNALNISLPSMLLKRASYGLTQTIQTLSQYEQGIFVHFLNSQSKNISRNARVASLPGSVPCGPYGLPPVLIYDAYSMIGGSPKCSQAVACMVKKFITNNSWNAPVFVLKGGFTEFKSHFPNWVDSGEAHKTTSYSQSKQQMEKLKLEQSAPKMSLNRDSADRISLNSSIDDEDLSCSPFSTSVAHHRQSTGLTIDTSTISSQLNYMSLTLDSLSGSPSVSASEMSKPSTNSISSADSSFLSGFQLPASKPIFRVRQNEEAMNIENCASHIDLENLSIMDSRDIKRLPEWFKKSVNINDNNILNYRNLKLVKRFESLENLERNRLNSLSKEVHQSVQIAGVEMGHKNRYRDILPFEDTRVKLVDGFNSNDYINASHLTSIGLDSMKNRYRYIATQGPLIDTIGDFWSMVASNNVPMVVALTEEHDGLMEKCANYWKTQKSTDGQVQVECLESSNYCVKNGELTEDKDGSIVLRRIQVEFLSDNSSTKFHQVIQLQLKDWHDLGTFDNNEELLACVFLKSYILDRYSSISYGNRDVPVVVHCSAGCGRTGTFCSLDSSIGYELNNYEPSMESSFDWSNDCANSLGLSLQNSNMSDAEDAEADQTVTATATPNLSQFELGAKDEEEEEEKFDPVYEIVKVFREQRVSTVQTLRQYLLIYDTLLVFYKKSIHNEIDRLVNSCRRVTVVERFFSGE